MVMPFFAFYQLNGGVVMAGLFSGAQAVCYTTVSLLSSRFLARANNGLLWALIGVSGFVICLGAMPVHHHPWFCGIMFSSAFIFSAFAWPAFHSWAGAEHDATRRAQNMGLLNVAWSSGAGIGPLLAGPMYVYDFRLPFLFIVCAGLTALFFIWLMPDERSWYGDATAELLTLRAAHDSASEAYLQCAFTATFAANVCVGVTRSVFPKRLDELVDAGALRLFSEAESLPWLNTAAASRFSWLVLAFGITMSLVFFILRHARWWHHRFSLLAAAQLLAAGAVFTLGHTHSLVIMAACFAVIGANLGVAFFSSVYYSMANPLRKHGRAAINEGAVGLGVLVGSFGLALMAGRLGLAAAFQYTPPALLAIILIQYLLLRAYRAPVIMVPSPTVVADEQTR